MNRSALERSVSPGDLVLLDTASLAAYFGNEATSPVAVELIDGFVHSGRNRALVSAVSAAELLVRPLRATRVDVADSITGFLRTFPNLDVVQVDLAVARIAAELRVAEALRMPDALIAASGLDRAARVAASDDRGWPATMTHNGSTMRVLALRSLLS